ncbi:hypothetical protein DRQ50_01455 [bacterium]|nr:MAG: hypothetical protein DRQ50_01455 [bacterium]
MRQRREIRQAMLESAAFQVEIDSALQAAEDLASPDLAQELANVEVPHGRLKARLGLHAPTAPQVQTRAQAEPSPGGILTDLIDKLRAMIWTPGFGYAVAVLTAIWFISYGTQEGPDAVTPWVWELSPHQVVRSGDDEVAIEEFAVDGDLAGATVDLRIMHVVNPTLPIRYRAILLDIEDPKNPTAISFTSDNRQFEIIESDMAYPVFRVAAHLLRPGINYELRLEPVGSDGEDLVTKVITARFRVSE